MEGLTAFGKTFVVAGQPAVCGQPRQRAFGDPSPRQDREAPLACGFTHHLDCHRQQPVGPADQGAGEPAAGEQVPESAAGEIHRQQEPTAAGGVVDAGRGDQDRQQQTEGVGGDEPLPAVDLLAGVVTAAGAADGVGTRTD